MQQVGQQGAQAGENFENLHQAWDNFVQQGAKAAEEWAKADALERAGIEGTDLVAPVHLSGGVTVNDELPPSQASGTSPVFGGEPPVDTPPVFGGEPPGIFGGEPPHTDTESLANVAFGTAPATLSDAFADATAQGQRPARPSSPRLRPVG